METKAKPRILVVDDEITVCKSIRSAILSDAYRVDTALSGEEALIMDGEAGYDLIITDLMMPGISGLELLKQIKETRPGAMVIMVTGYPTIKTAVQSVKLGAFDYIPKPFTPKELRSLVGRALRHIDREKGPQAGAFEIPAGLHYIGGHTWLRREGATRATIGVLPEFLVAVRRLTAIELPQAGGSLFQGEVCVRITDDTNQTHRVWSPVTGRIAAVHNELSENPDLVRQSPFQEGWLFQIESVELDEELKALNLSQ